MNPTNQPNFHIEDIEHAQKLIESCLQHYYTYHEIMNYLQDHNVRPELTTYGNLVKWSTTVIQGH